MKCPDFKFTLSVMLFIFLKVASFSYCHYNKEYANIDLISLSSTKGIFTENISENMISILHMLSYNANFHVHTAILKTPNLGSTFSLRLLDITKSISENILCMTFLSIIILIVSITLPIILSKYRTLKKQIEKTNGKNIELYEMSMNMFANLTDEVILIIDSDFKFKKAFGKMLERFSIPSDYFLEKTIFKIFGEKIGNIHKRACENAFQGKNVIYKWDFTHKGALHYFQTSLSPIRSKNQDIISLISITRNIDKVMNLGYSILKIKKERIFEKTIRDLFFIANGIAHEINNPLTSIMTAVELLLIDFNGDSEQRQLLLQIKLEVIRIKNAMDYYMQFTRQRKYDFKRSDIHKILSKFLNEIKDIIPETIRIKKELLKEDIYVNISPDDIREVFLNIMKNAFESINGKGEVIIKTERENGNVSIFFKDTGCGIKDEHLEKIFEPYFTTKDVKKAFGLGLTSSLIIINAHKGRITMNSVEGSGSEFIITLPICSDPNTLKK